MQQIATRKLGKFASQEIENRMRGLSGKPAAAEAQRLANLHNVSIQEIYRRTKDFRTSTRKPRADRGKRAFELDPKSDLWKTIEFILVDKLDPDLALETAIERGYKNQPSIATLRRILADNGLNLAQRKAAKRSHRRWEAENPGEIFQVDVTGLKTRWMDLKTRGILKIDETEINRNHPNMNKNLVRVWQIMLIDDFSRRRFLKYLATDKPTSDDIVRFLVEAFESLGVPKMLYTDNGSEFKGRHKQAEKILNELLETSGGYVHKTHLPHNAQATGKVEVAHKWAEKFDKLIGLAKNEGRIVTVEMLNNFSQQILRKYNEHHVNRSTGQTPMARWFSKPAVLRILPSEIIESALLSDCFECKLDESMTISYRGVSYKVPSERPFVNWIGHKVSVVIPPKIELILISLPDGEEYTISKVLATADAAGEFKQTAESKAQILLKQARETRKEEIKAIKARAKETEQIEVIPYIDTVVKSFESKALQFPHKEIKISAEEIAANVKMPSQVYDKSLSYYEAFNEFRDQFSSGEETYSFLDTVYKDRDEIHVESELQTAFENREFTKRRSLLKAV
jgi:transposase InsO family protein